MLRKSEFPTRENCDPNDPEEALLWMLMGLPGMRGAAMIMPVKVLRMWSKRLWDCGARPSADPTVFYHPPKAGDINPTFAAGQWKETPYVPTESPVDVSKLSMAMKLELARQLREKVNADAPDVPRAVVGRLRDQTNLDVYDPGEHTIAEVREYLETQSEVERNRVIAVEIAGRARKALLRDYT